MSTARTASPFVALLRRDWALNLLAASLSLVLAAGVAAVVWFWPMALVLIAFGGFIALPVTREMYLHGVGLSRGVVFQRAMFLAIWLAAFALGYGIAKWLGIPG